MASSHWPPPLVNTMAGMRWPSFSRCSLASTRCVYASENARNAPSASTPPQLSKIITACAPASIWQLRYAATASALIARMRCIRSGRAYISVLTWR